MFAKLTYTYRYRLALVCKPFIPYCTTLILVLALEDELVVEPYILENITLTL